MDKSNREGIVTGQGTSLIFIGEIISFAFSLILFSVMTRLFTFSQVGLISAMLVFINLFAIAGLFGVHYALARFIREYRSKGQNELAAGIYRKILLFSFLSSLVFSLLFFSLMSFLSPFLFGLFFLESLMFFASLDLVFTMLSHSLNGAMFGLQKFKGILFGRIIWAISRTILGISLILLRLGVFALVFAWVVSDILLVCIFLINTWNEFPEPSDEMKLKEVLSYSTPAGGWELIQSLSKHIDRILILLLAGTALLGIYAPAYSIYTAVLIIPLSFRGPLFIHLSGNVENNKTSGRVSFLASKYLFLVYIPIAITIAVFSPFLILIISGFGYEAAVLPLRILVLVSTITSYIAITEALILSMGTTRTLVTAISFGIIISVIITIFLLPILGLVGAVAAKSGMDAFILFFQFRSTSKLTSVEFDWNTFVKIWIASFIMWIPLIISWIIGLHFIYSVILTLFGIVLFFVITKITRVMNESDAVFISNLLPPKIRPFFYRMMVLLMV